MGFVLMVVALMIFGLVEIAATKGILSALIIIALLITMGDK